MRAFFKYFGSKHRICARLPPPRFGTIVEPFAGSAAYATTFARPDTRVLLYDTSERTCALWAYLIRVTPAEIMALPVDPIADGQDIRTLGLAPEPLDLLRHWIAISGSHSWSMAPSLRPAIGLSGVWGYPVRARLAKQVEMIRHWEIRCESYENAPDIEAHWHIDPPYQNNAHGFSEYGCAAGAIDYAALAEWCKARRGDVTVHEQIGAEWLPFAPLHRRAVTAGLKGAKDGEMKRQVEMIWTNERRGKDGTIAMPGLVGYL